MNAKFSPHEDPWLLATAVLHEIGLPTLEAAPEVAEAAFAIAVAVEAAALEELPGEKTQAKDEEPEDTKFTEVKAEAQPPPRTYGFVEQRYRRPPQH